jgi:hypothetical protein
MARLWTIIDRGRTLTALAGFACVGLGFATIVPMVFSSAGQMRDFAPGIAVSSVTALGHLGLLLGPHRALPVRAAPSPRALPKPFTVQLQGLKHGVKEGQEMSVSKKKTAACIVWFEIPADCQDTKGTTFALREMNPNAK